LTKRALERGLRVQVLDSDLDALQNYYIEIIESGGPALEAGKVDHGPSGAGS
jgi:hypothetical protein